MSDILDLKPLLEITDGDSDYEKELLGELFDDGDEIIEKIQNLFPDGDPFELGEEVHKLKGCLGYIACKEIMERISTLETKGRKEKEMPSSDEFNKVINDYKEVKEAIEKYLS